MDIFGIKNIKEKELNFSYDSHYKKLGMSLKNAKTDNDKKEMIENSNETLRGLLETISIDEKGLKENFINLLLDEKSSQYLWILYSKSKNEENYIDKISNTLKQENKVTRAGTNTYKINGWMAHTLYVYQILNYNIANKIEIRNFNGNYENKLQVDEMHNIYNSITNESKFVLKIFSLIHDIGVIEDVKYHDKLGRKYVDKVLEEIGLNQDVLVSNKFLIDMSVLTNTLKQLITYHTLITSLSSEGSDICVAKEYMKLLNGVPENQNIKRDIPKILLLLAYADIIAVDESLMDSEKYARIKEGYNFFENITQGIMPERNKELVAIERICDMVGESKIQNLVSNFDNILNKYNIDKKVFSEDMYNIKFMRYTGPLMKSLKDTELTIKIFYEVFELIGVLESKEELKKYTIFFVPDKHEKYFVEQFKNGNFFKCVEKMKESKENKCIYECVSIETEINEDGKYLHIRIV